VTSIAILGNNLKSIGVKNLKKIVFYLMDISSWHEFLQLYTMYRFLVILKQKKVSKKSRSKCVLCENWLHMPFSLVPPPHFLRSRLLFHPGEGLTGIHSQLPNSHRDRKKSRFVCTNIEAHRRTTIFVKISLDRKLQADSKNGVQIEIQAKTDQVMGPQKVLIFEKNLFYPKLACL